MNIFYSPFTINEQPFKTTMKTKNIAIVTTCIDDWGGSEELWGRSVPYFLEKNFEVTIYKSKINAAHPEYISLIKKGVQLKELLPQLSLANRVARKSRSIIKRSSQKIHLPESFINNDEPLTVYFKKHTPVLVIISQGINFDGLNFGYECSQLNIPYVIICQKAVDFYWPPPQHRSFMIETLIKAEKVFFVSQHNRRLTEEQFGTRLTNAEVIFNPVKVSGNIVAYPSSNNGFRLACVARLFVIDKGQDILLRILNKKKWRERPLTISFIGSGLDENGLFEMAALLNISNVKFTGHVHDIENIWQHHHAFILPSRSEGLPLSMMEAMAAGRTVIVSKAGGNAEIVEDGVTGFMGQANEESFEEAMERAWIKKDEWEAMGKKASLKIAAVVPSKPEKIFANYINEIINEQ